MNERTTTKISILLLTLTLLIPFAFAAPGDTLYQNNGTGISANDWANAGGGQFIWYPHSAQANAIRTNETGQTCSACFNVNSTGADWTGKTLNITFTYGQAGQVFPTGTEFYGFGVTSDLTTPNNPGGLAFYQAGNNDCNFVTGNNYCLYDGNVGRTPWRAVATSGNGNFTITMVINTSTNTSNVRLYFNGVLNATMNGDIEGNVRGLWFATGNPLGTADIDVFNITVCDQYCSAAAGNATNSTPQNVTVTFTAKDAGNATSLNTFCVSGSGTNNSFTTCTTNGTVTNTKSGTYNYTANASGYLPQTISNVFVQANTSFQFNLTFNSSTNNPPVLQTVSTTISADNTTFNGFANATDNDTSTLTYAWVLLKNGVTFDSGTSSSFTQGVTSNFKTSTLSTNGSYAFRVTANDGINNSNTLTTANVTVTFAPPPPAPPALTTADKISVAISTFVGLLAMLVIILLIYLLLHDLISENEYAQKALLSIIALLLLGLALVVIWAFL